MSESSKKEMPVWGKLSIVCGILIILIILIAIIWIKTHSYNTTPTSNQSAVTRLQQVNNWQYKYGYIYQTLSDDFTLINKDRGNLDYSAIVKDCQKQLDDITIAQGFPVFPDAQTASDFSSSLSYYATSAQLCITGVNNMDATLISESDNALKQGSIKTDAMATDISNLTAQLNK